MDFVVWKADRFSNFSKLNSADSFFISVAFLGINESYEATPILFRLKFLLRLGFIRNKFPSGFCDM